MRILILGIILFALCSLPYTLFSQFNFSVNINTDTIKSQIYTLKSDSVFKVIQGLTIIKRVGGNWSIDIIDTDGSIIDDSKILKIILSRKTDLPEPRIFYKDFYHRLRT